MPSGCNSTHPMPLFRRSFFDRARHITRANTCGDPGDFRIHVGLLDCVPINRIL
jgi:hypothetical protein